MRKVIVKSQLANADALVKKLEEGGFEFEPAVWQHERVYLPHNFRPRMNFPRLVMRTEVQETDQPAQYSLYLKRHIEDSGIDYVNFTAVGDYTETTGIVHQLGFKKVTEVSRQRRMIRLDAQTMIYLDTIEGIETPFVKIEAELIDGMSVEATRKELFKSLKLFGQETFLVQTYAEILVGNQMQPYYLPE